MKINEILILLKSHNTLILAEECIIAIQEKDNFFKFYKKSFNKNKVIEVLSKRLARSEKENLIGTDDLLHRLNEYDQKLICLMKISINCGTYSVYYTQDRNTVLGVVRNNFINSERYLKLEKDYLSKGCIDYTVWEK